MAHYSSRFTGHIEYGDPRSPVTVAGGCRWPTIPPFRLLLGSTNSTGLYVHFNTEPILFQLDLASARHDHGIWMPTDLPWWLYRARIEKLYSRAMHPRYQWFCTILLTLVGREEIAVAARTRRCNVDVRFGNQIGGPIRGRVGTQFGFKQVEFDQLTPP